MGHPHTHDGLAPKRLTRRPIVIWAAVVLLLVAAVSAAFFAYARVVHGTPTQPARTTLADHPAAPLLPADRFIQSIVTEDGALGWNQLCPNIQSQIPLDALVQQTNAQRAALAQHGVHLTKRFVSRRPQPDGGMVHVYVVTAHWPGGATQTRTYAILTQPSGCVEDVQTP